MSNEIIVLKRVEEVAEAKKGGVWKIAHADFMTAMMAFFLIMWLVNATDEEIKKSIANYFNPMNLMDAPSDRRGIMDPDKDTRPPASGDEAGKTAGERPLGSDTPGEGGGAGGGGNVEEGNQNKMESAGILEQTDGAEFDDPYAVLASSAVDLSPEDPVSIDVPDSTLGTTGTTSTSDAMRDPFDPAYWQTTSTRAAQSLRPGPSETADVLPPDSAIDAADRRPTEVQPSGHPAPASTTAAADSANAAPPASRAPSDTAGDVGPHSSVAEAVLAAFGDAPETDATDTAVATVPTPSPDAGGSVAAARPDPVAEAANELRSALAGVAADVDVAPGDTTVAISVTDDAAFSMFPIGSSAPTAEAVRLFARVAEVLSQRRGRVVVRGHTDARPFRAGRSDNWVLSFERAHATKEALVANGIDESRIARVEGLADRQPTRPDDPLADENRRIEILYEPDSEAL
ncbi:flagellar motor protein MotB [Acuticoccus mangrovi]|uniref:OmpA family protein n=1 Tax=Acuticoccus mangrovi TaxID=2796142 RepID=A0A934MIE9_9HYPH|nr:flagellar motor protein MotB [Acuticoccus mangrovi]MBJ3778693.1 OmpA family protein [Acuticoccus mangrovi]